ncbi:MULTISPECIES: DNA polymerase IV [unclassified Algoriphagus]|jgi:DNA polymerase-4|uniref:DNA polymerase IV n=2 Tax=Algoriphagus TaxID=246875 RepID=UPI000C4CD72A|nr:MULTISPECIES: DNA polymerase IV [unclassified Algoriphagus]MAL12887.1 DNA polymerase IV [Algoriphagus sp.]QYH39161.1 DNA polymerase IV [Algoriphagus sp. NBT04N3]HAD50010.1 DNA polymerase IV [Algoriphagus sp.]HCH45081.1 DNA polymerase IV [Algoriphagus sp.]|tara:strand:- start:3078 stop:4268 length:1191 start_codon:yes stop_codon:yes gene_type:complete
MEGKRSIAHMDLDTFFVSVERLFDSRLNGKPILIGGSSDRGVVASCSYEARRFGVHSAMPMRTARQLCPEAIIVKGDFEKYSQKSHEVTEIIKESVPLFEKSSIDEFYIDLTGMDRFFGCFKLAHELRQRIIKESGLNISMGLSENKTVSKVATGEAKPNNEKQVPNGEEKPFLAPLSVRKIPMIGEKTSQTLYNMGVKKVLTLQQMPSQLLEATFGKNGKMIWEKANGIDRNPVIPYSEAKSVSSENTFEEDTIDVKMLEATLVAMTEQLATKLRQKGQLTACVSVKIRYSDFETHTMQQRIPYTSADHSILPVVKELFKKLYSRRLLIRLIGVRFSNLVYGNYQIKLFEDSQEQINLYQALDKLNVKYGDKTVCRAVAMGVGRRWFYPFNGMEV